MILPEVWQADVEKVSFITNEGVPAAAEVFNHYGDKRLGRWKVLGRWMGGGKSAGQVELSQGRSIGVERTLKELGVHCCADFLSSIFAEIHDDSWTCMGCECFVALRIHALLGRKQLQN